jgi:Ca2+-binding RTX toxin-like protein
MRAILAAVGWAGVLALPASAFAELIHDSDASHVRRGTPQRDAIYGHGGNDTLLGKQRADRIFGGTGYDNLFGGRGRDLLVDRRGGADISGGVGADVIRVHRLRDRGAHLKGDRGNDVFHIYGPFHSGPYRGVSAEGGPGRDRIHIYGRLGWVKVFVRGDGKRDHVWCHRDSYDIVVKGPADVLHNRPQCDVVY